MWRPRALVRKLQTKPDACTQAAGFGYHRMDGSTAVGVRARLVDDFNSNGRMFVFLLTTKVGGLGINLTGADRCAPPCYGSRS